MDHVVYLDAAAKELDRILCGGKDHYHPRRDRAEDAVWQG